MEDYILTAELDEQTTLHVSPLHHSTYGEHIATDNLGGVGGYFITRTVRTAKSQQFDILAKAPSFEAAADLFDMIVGGAAHRAPA